MMGAVADPLLALPVVHHTLVLVLQLLVGLLEVGRVEAVLSQVLLVEVDALDEASLVLLVVINDFEKLSLVLLVLIEALAELVLVFPEVGNLLLEVGDRLGRFGVIVSFGSVLAVIADGCALSGVVAKQEVKLLLEKSCVEQGSIAAYEVGHDLDDVLA
ncbi:hypothetical protein PG995_007261 [Apiospora arundinis]|uniref:Uncharacterized protein n=1 Tax=Apiospora arundinis TaxID=335852 RepID=A0ABR2JIE7_9PEZI